MGAKRGGRGGVFSRLGGGGRRPDGAVREKTKDGVRGSKRKQSQIKRPRKKSGKDASGLGTIF